MANGQVNCNLELKGEFSEAVGPDENIYGESRSRREKSDLGTKAYERIEATWPGTGVA